MWYFLKHTLENKERFPNGVLCLNTFIAQVSKARSLVQSTARPQGLISSPGSHRTHHRVALGNATRKVDTGQRNFYFEIQRWYVPININRNQIGRGMLGQLMNSCGVKHLRYVGLSSENLTVKNQGFCVLLMVTGLINVKILVKKTKSQ